MVVSSCLWPRSARSRSPRSRRRGAGRRRRLPAPRGALLLGHRVVLHDLALEDPDLDADDAVGRRAPRRSRSRCRRAACAAARGPRDTIPCGRFRRRRAGRSTLMRMPSRAEPHGRLHGALHGAAEGDAALELLGDVFGDQRGVDLGLAHLDDVEVDLRCRSSRRSPCAASRCRRPSCR